MENCILNCLWRKEMERQITVIYGNQWECEGPFQLTGIAEA